MEIALIWMNLIFVIVYYLLLRKNRSLRELIVKLSNDWQQTVQSKNRVITVLSHEVMMPLRHISLVARRGGADMDLPGHARRSFQKIRFAAETLYQTSQNVVGWMKYQEDTLAFTPERLYPAQVAKKVTDLLADIAESKGNKIKNHIPAELSWQADRTVLHILLLNLVSNAIKFTEKGMISIHGRVEEDRLILTVRDSGIGFREDILQQLTGHGALTSSPGTREESGNGMGFTIIRHFLLLLGGSFEIENRPGRGAAVTITLGGGKLENRKVWQDYRKSGILSENINN